MLDPDMGSSDEAASKIVAGVVLLRGDGAVLLQLRDDIPTIQDPGIWVVPGGHVEPGETPLEGACREFQEETNYRCTAPKLLAKYSSRALGYSSEFEMFFFWENYDGIQQIECREGVELTFRTRSECGQLPRRSYLTEIWDMALCAAGQIV